MSHVQSSYDWLIASHVQARCSHFQMTAWMSHIYVLSERRMHHPNEQSCHPTWGTEWIVSAPEWIIFFWRNSHFVKQQAADKNFSKLQIPLFSTCSITQKRTINKGIRTQSAIQIDRHCPMRIRSRKIKAKHDKRNHQNNQKQYAMIWR